MSGINMRKLNLEDAFKLGRIISDTNIFDNDGFDGLFALLESGKANEAAIYIINKLLPGLTNEKTSYLIYDLLSGITDKNIEDIKQMDLTDFPPIIKEIIEINGDLKNFFKLALPQIKKKD